ncbi:toxin-antitoxin system, toxin component [Streptomyces sp. NPDC056309]|uniref:toxin-antitoxin system, toxin component n=1 Tax=unclassified Streptomyces TaxID=2593676 RepID=UPI0035DDB413
MTLPAPARPADPYTALCEAMSRRRGRPVRFRTAAFPPGTADGPWPDMTDQDLVLVEERTAPDHQLVILGHELRHMRAGHGGHHVDGAGVATRLLDDGTDLQATVRRAAARSRSGLAEEETAAESLGLLPAGKFHTWQAGSSPRGPVRRDRPAGRIEAPLGYLGRLVEEEDVPGRNRPYGQDVRGAQGLIRLS